MKIGFFTDTYFPQINGVTYTISLWKKELEKRGHEVYVYYPEDKGYTAKEREVPLKSLSFFFYKGYKLGLPSQGKVEKDLDIIHIHGLFSMAAFGLAMARKMKIPSVLTYHTPADLYLGLLSSRESIQDILKTAYKVYEKELLERVDLITTPSEVIRDVLQKKWGDKIARVVALSNGVDTEFFREVDTKAFKKKYGIKEGKVIGFTGRHNKEKHVDELINIADRFDGQVLIAGDGPERADFEEMAKGQDNIKFLGFLPREELPAFYSCLDVLCFPSRVETQGLVVLEANACGTPVVGADALALKETIDEGVNGFRYKPGDLDDIYSKISLIYKRLGAMKKSSVQYAKKESVGNIMGRLERIYGELR